MTVLLTHRSASRDELLNLLDRWTERGWLRELDRAFARFLATEVPEASPLLLVAAAFASHQLGRGHVCLDLQATLVDASFVLSLPPEDDGDTPEERPQLPTLFLAGLDLPSWQAALRQPALVGEGPGATPLVLAGPRLYLRRYWQYERDVALAIAQRLAQSPALPEAALRQALHSLFPPAAGIHPDPDWQKLACALAARHAFSIITGGPGTGKTTTVVKLLAVLQSLAQQGQGARRLRIRLAAPTGKAAARLNESIAGAVQRLPLQGLPNADAVRAAIPSEVSTLHRLLGSRPDSRHFRHNASHPLPLDVLVVDEASMVDLEMAAALLVALPAEARLILLGDKDQLASVEAGAVLGELCARALAGHYTPATRDWLAQVAGQAPPPGLLDPQGRPLDQAVTMLRHSHRFTADSGIGQLAEAVNTGSVAAVREVWAQQPADLMCLTDLERDDDALRHLVIEGSRRAPSSVRGKGPNGPNGYQHYLTLMCREQPPEDAEPEAFDAWARAVLAAHTQFQVLCALRRGAWGVEGMNQRIAALLLRHGLIPADQGWYLGRPVLVTRNDYGLNLMNGDIGITLALPHRAPGSAQVEWILRVAFAGGAQRGAIQWVLPSRLQAVETVYAMTVHKSQGSEFDHAALVLPPVLNPVLTRELVYTGISRARRWFTLACASRGLQVLEAAVERRVVRASGLLED